MHMDEKFKKSISKFLSLVLRHQPETIGIELDESGWVAVDDLLEKMQTARNVVSIEQLREVVATNDKKRFEFNSEASKIRASQGHSVDVALGYEPMTPPDELLHGTVDRFVNSIRSQGLLKGNRHHVHLHCDLSVATQVGERRGQAVVLRIDSKAMHETGIEFFQSSNGVWLTLHVPPQYIQFPIE